MIVAPYKRWPAPVTVGVVDQAGRLVLEHGVKGNLDRVPPNTVVFVAWGTARELLAAGEGEALCWNNREVRWRHRRFEDDWQPRPSDAIVLRVAGGERLPAGRLLGACVAWRDWLAGYGARPGTTGSAAWSLLRATLQRVLFCSAGDRPPIRFPIGGRRELGPRGPGTYRGLIEHVDMPAAYASTLAGLSYGGRWDRVDSVPGGTLERWSESGLPLFVRARVRVPESVYGPLPRRSRSRPQNLLEAFLFAADYPTGLRLQGVWTWQELEAAVEHGARVEQVLEAWVHRLGRPVFAPWWEAVHAGRSLPGLAGMLAKQTGNALWGRFCLEGDGRRTIRAGRQVRELPARPAPFAAHDLAETVSGRVRARLYRMMVDQGEHLLAAHTDGAWLEAADSVPDGWRLDKRARRIDLLTPQALRYYPSGRRAVVVMAGILADQVDEAFEREWAAAGFGGVG